MAQLLYGSGLRLMECVRLRVKDLDLPRAQITVRDAKGGKDSGCDSLGYSIQKRIGVVRVNRSGVGPIKFREGVEAISKRNSRQERPVTSWT